VKKDLTSLKLFIVDDDKFCRMLYQQHLLNLGFNNIYLFDNGEDCLNNLHMKPDIIMVDYDMTPFDGLELIRKIRKIDPAIYLLLISGQKDIRVALDALRSGAFDYIIKGEEDLAMISNATAKVRELVKMAN
jgi:DNA-binding NtrC family response regulator